MPSNPEVLHQMDAHILNWKSKSDSRHIFLSCYRMMTSNMLDAINKNEFHDSEWIYNLLHRFADYYFDALNCYDCGDKVPKVWQEVHQLTQTKKMRHVQYLLIGVNAHINYDLVLTLVDMLNEEWPKLTEIEKIKRFEDHCKVNEIIGATIDKVQDEILAPADPFMGWIDKAFGRLDEYLLSRLITTWRKDVWDNALQIMETKENNNRELIRISIENHVCRRSNLLAFGD